MGHHVEGLHEEEVHGGVLHEGIIIPELEIRENARWLAILIDTEGSLGWVRETARQDRIDEKFRYEYVYRVLEISVGMDELESKRTVDEGARMLGVSSYTMIDPRTKTRARRFNVAKGRALSAASYMKPYFDKFYRLANLCLTLFKYHAYIPIDRFDKVIIMLFGRYVGPKEANLILLKMIENEFKDFLKKAEELTDLYLH